MRISLQRGKPYRAAPQKSPSFYGDFSLRSKTHCARFTPITPEIFAAYGINPRFFHKGGWISIMPKNVYNECAKEFNSEGSLALYPFTPSYDEFAFEAILRGEKNSDSKEWRVIALPETFSAITLLHEILHDIYLGGALDPYDKQVFSNKVLVCLRKASKDNGLKDFFERVKTRSGVNYPLAKSRSNQMVLKDIEFQIFVNECFAYAGEYLATKKFSVPQEISFFFRSLRLFTEKNRNS